MGISSFTGYAYFNFFCVYRVKRETGASYTIEGKDVFVTLSTWYRKLVCFQSILFMLDHLSNSQSSDVEDTHIAIVVEPTAATYDTLISFKAWGQEYIGCFFQPQARGQLCKASSYWRQKEVVNIYIYWIFWNTGTCCTITPAEIGCICCWWGTLHFHLLGIDLGSTSC